MPALRAARMEQKIVKVPENEVVVALSRSQAAVGRGADLEKDLAVGQQGEKLDPRKTILPAEPFDVLRRRQRRNSGGDLRTISLPRRRM